MSNTLIRDAVITSLIFLGGFYAYAEREKIYEYVGVTPQDIVNARQQARERTGEGTRQTANSGINASSLSQQKRATPQPTREKISVIKKSLDGQYWTSASINDVKVKFLIDTGASVVVLTPADARKIGLRPDNLNYTSRVNTASGQIYAAPIKLTSISVGDVTVYNVRAVVIPRGLTHSLLGMSYLGQLKKMEVTSNEMVLHR